MRSKAPLVLMEQLLMVLVFALAAALCLQVFVLSAQTSEKNEERDRAVTLCQTAAETLKHCHGDYAAAAALLGGQWDGHTWGLSYDKDWEVTGGTGAYVVFAVPADSGSPLLGAAEVMALRADGEPLFGLSAAWQEVSGHA